jgi:hypothetical protein
MTNTKTKRASDRMRRRRSLTKKQAGSRSFNVSLDSPSLLNLSGKITSRYVPRSVVPKWLRLTAKWKKYALKTHPRIKMMTRARLGADVGGFDFNRLLLNVTKSQDRFGLSFFNYEENS